MGLLGQSDPNYSSHTKNELNLKGMDRFEITVNCCIKEGEIWQLMEVQEVDPLMSLN
jgi:hypothetical protein